MKNHLHQLIYYPLNGTIWIILGHLSALLLLASNLYCIAPDLAYSLALDAPFFIFVSPKIGRHINSQITLNGTIITWTRARAERDAKAREDILAKIKLKLEKKKVSAKDFVSNKTYQRYVVGLNNDDAFELNEEAIAEDKQRDGFFGVLTNNNKMSA